MKTLIIGIAVVSLICLGCQQQSVQPAQQSVLTPEELGELGAKIMRQPEKTRELLTEKGLDEQKFEQAIRRVSENRDEAQRYAAAFRRQSRSS